MLPFSQTMASKYDTIAPAIWTLLLGGQIFQSHTVVIPIRTTAARMKHVRAKRKSGGEKLNVFNPAPTSAMMAAHPLPQSHMIYHVVNRHSSRGPRELVRFAPEYRLAPSQHKI